ncbi:ZIP family metal transporter [Limnohabitans radicicola]|uniref:ZIP family metal transporter n=1 Tax=Limnohabitans radicicola TaxID=2771427 RepID=A0A927IMY5_9BURK|nr:ZIP family metal transporter [Limnohabitans radicicola]MBD8051681.1 ZIP family metal transporter [Limnohabitans radicicola]
MTLLTIWLGTLIAGIGSVWIAAWLSFGVLSRYTQHMLSLAAGALLATAFLHLLPEAFEGQVGAQGLFMTLLLGLVFFFLLDKAELWHHGHEHHHGGGHGHEHHHGGAHGDGHHYGEAHGHAHHHHGHDHAHAPTGAGKWALLAGDSVHCFGDGILIASAFMADFSLGVLAALAVLAHEVPHHMGDLVVLRQDSDSRQTAIVKVSLAGAVTALGGTVGYVLVDALHDYLPYFLVVASSSFIYVALADLIPQLQKRLSARETAAQVTWLAVGMGMVMLVSQLAAQHR